MDTSSVTPSDAVVALRSFPRRYREATAVRPGDDPARLHGTPGPRGRSVLDLVVDTVRSLVLLRRAVEEVLTTDGPVLHPAVVDRTARHYDVAAHGELAEVLGELDDVAPGFADRIAHVPTDDWTRTGTPVDGTPTTALALIGEAVGTAADNLREIDDTVAAVRAAG